MPSTYSFSVRQRRHQSRQPDRVRPLDENRVAAFRTSSASVFPVPHYRNGRTSLAKPRFPQFSASGAISSPTNIA
jgi:hypothetical protein